MPGPVCKVILCGGEFGRALIDGADVLLADNLTLEQNVIVENVKAQGQTLVMMSKRLEDLASKGQLTLEQFEPVEKQHKATYEASYATLVAISEIP